VENLDDIDEAISASMVAVAAIDRVAHPNFVVGIDSNIWWMRSVNGERFDDDQVRRIQTSIGRLFMAEELTLTLGFTRANRAALELLDAESQPVLAAS
jgi:hypothetical protein